ncbi:MAG: four helix bundle protein [Patescibacteria group bacterium]
MSNLGDLPLYVKTYKLQKYLYLLIRNFKKEYKYTLGQSILECAWEVLDTVVMANILPNDQKAESIRQASASFDRLKIRLRMAHELKLIAYKQYTFIISQNEEIGKMLSGWLKWAEKNKIA